MYNTKINDSDLLWRYMDLSKFMSLLEDEALFFTRADNFEDKFEGSFPKVQVKQRENGFIESKLFLKKISESYKEHCKQVFISCWHQNNFESEAMWKLYSTAKEAIAVQTNVGALKGCLNGPTQLNVYIGKVNYINYDSDMFPDNDKMAPFFYKRKAFEYEHEVRAVIEDLNRTVLEGGINVEIDIKALIQKIYISPLAGKWFFHLVEKILSTYGLSNIEVVYSHLNNEPTF